MAEEKTTNETPDDAIVDEFIGSGLRAGRIEELCDALRMRIRAMREDLLKSASDVDRADLEKRIKQARYQVSVLRQEQAISQFVEDSVRATLRQETVNPDPDDEDW